MTLASAQQKQHEDREDEYHWLLQLQLSIAKCSQETFCVHLRFKGRISKDNADSSDIVI